MKVKAKLEIEFAGLTLPVEKNADGLDVVALLPICEVFGLEWRRQAKKVSEPYLTRRLGTCTVRMYRAGQLREMVCVRVDRVAAFLNRVNPDQVRAAGNDLSADFLEQKQCEWDDVIHDYEKQRGTMLREVSGEGKQLALSIRSYVSAIKAKNATEDAEERRVLGQFARRVATEAGIPYQEELVP